MQLTWGYNDTLKNNPVIVIIGSSHAVSLNLSPPDTMQYKLQQLINDNWGGATIHNLGVPGEYTDHWLPTELGGLPDRNIDAANSYNPDIIILVGPTNDAQYNTPEQATANLQTIAAAAKGKFFVHSPIRRGDYDANLLARLAAENVLWTAAFPYVLFRLWDILEDPFGPDFQSDHIHLSPQGTTKQADAMFAVLDRELRANTAYLRFDLDRSDDGAGGWGLFDQVVDQQVIRKTFAKQPGYYRMRAALKDGSYTAYSNIVQIMNAVPTANAGPDQNLPAGNTSVVLNGSGSDTDGTIVSYLWTVISGAGLTLQDANTPTVTVNGLADGQSYTLRLTVTDNWGASGSDDVNITVGAVSAAVSQFNFCASPADIPGWETIAGQPHLAVLSGSHNGITVDTVATNLWGNLGGTTASDVNGEDTPNPVFAFNAEVTRSFFFTYSNTYTPGNENVRISGFNPGEVVPLIEILGSRDAAGVSFATRLCDYTLVDANGSYLVHDFDVKGNTANLVTYQDMQADANGVLLLAVYRRLPIDGNHEVGYLNAMRITRNI
ncbi:hypothetical protein GCM10009415_49360 [Chitinophaga japonensis]